MEKNLDLTKLNIKKIQDIVKSSSIDELKVLLPKLKLDNRTSIKKISTQVYNKIIFYENEKKRIENLYEFHNVCKSKYNAKHILCVDEVGRGPLAGPVTVAGVILIENPYIFNVNDSKKLNQNKRKEIFETVKEKNIFYLHQSLNSKTIDKLNILATTFLAMKKLVLKIENVLEEKIDLILVDGNQKIPDINNRQIPIEQGDKKVYGISLASIIAKEIRDNIMVNFDKIYPEYSFSKNKGYGTKEHISAIKKYGICPIHRRSFLKNI